MKYDFDKVIDRSGTNSLKWESGQDELPMWVADMDFQTAPQITKALAERAAHGIFGYSIIPEVWYDSYANWWRERHNFPLKKNWLIFCTGIVPAISSLVRRLTSPAEKVLIQTPVYSVFFNSILNNGRQAIENPLKYDGKRYEIDFDDLEKKLSDPLTTLMLLCNPHNPTGNIWDKETLSRIGELCFKYHVTVISDEIHCDLTAPGISYIPFASVSEHCAQNSVTCLSPSKAFNLAGLQSAAVCVPEPMLRGRVSRALNNDEIAEPNSFAVTGAAVAFTEGGEWLDELRAYLAENRKTAEQFIAAEIPEIKAVPSQATYLMWLDCGTLSAAKITAFLRKKANLRLTDGTPFGGNGASFLRMNIACPKALLEKGLERLKKIKELQ